VTVALFPHRGPENAQTPNAQRSTSNYFSVVAFFPIRVISQISGSNVFNQLEIG